jgi:hypothetical protein
MGCNADSRRVKMDSRYEATYRALDPTAVCGRVLQLQDH